MGEVGEGSRRQSTQGSWQAGGPMAGRPPDSAILPATERDLPISLYSVAHPYEQYRGVSFCPTVRGQPKRARLYPTDYNYLCVHGWSVTPGFAGFYNDSQGVCSHPLAAIGRSAEKPMVV